VKKWHEGKIKPTDVGGSIYYPECQSCSKSVHSQLFVNRVINVWNNLSQDMDFSSFNLFKCAIENMDLFQYLKYDK